MFYKITNIFLLLIIFFIVLLIINYKNFIRADIGKVPTSINIFIATILVGDLLYIFTLAFIFGRMFISYINGSGFMFSFKFYK
jgi:hypothetical protein